MAYKCGALSLEEDGYCVLCGVIHTNRDLVTKSVKTTKPTPEVQVEVEPVEFPTFKLWFEDDTPVSTVIEISP